MEAAGALPERRRRVWPLAIAIHVVLLLALLAVSREGAAAVVLPVVIAALALTVTVWALFLARRQRMAYEARLTAWAGERAAQAERLRIARELHDIVSHGLGLITVRATTARYPGAEDDSAAALSDIERIGRQTTTELRRMLNVLRDSTDMAAPLRPAESLHDLPAIVEDAERAGPTVTLKLGEIDDISSGAQLAICSVVREALTNTARHAGPTSANVYIRRDGGWIVTSVWDEGRVDGWTPHPGSGHGIEGLRERVTAIGGTFQAEHVENGFRVTARIPEARTP
ncbi:histidine kinase [Planotetraspora sp. A-T 1434]|uniref:sensor histidine kinase n=1 Tax=Planotetraspora sp. A-T 1434 TaxID=2979219 RepID=UPI0021BFDA6C|nr:histidine kinase [Planotetraspora sp. A-T 1434]MCT9929916.1 histidine kinase [Planotetraspora sp. A-T 1434]